MVKHVKTIDSNLIADRLRFWLREKKLSQRQFAIRAGMEQTYVSQIINRKMKDNTLSTVKKIADALEIPVSVFIGEVDNDERVYIPDAELRKLFHEDFFSLDKRNQQQAINIIKDVLARIKESEHG